MVPIQREFAEKLLGHSPQPSLLPSPTLALFKERVYFSDPKTRGRLRRGSVILFYEPKRNRGSGEIVAIGRITDTYLRSCDEIGANLFERSTLRPPHMSLIGKSPVKTVTHFDNLFVLPNPVGLRSLNAIGLKSGNDFITARLITDAQYQSIIEEGFRSG